MLIGLHEKCANLLTQKTEKKLCENTLPIVVSTTNIIYIYRDYKMRWQF